MHHENALAVEVSLETGLRIGDVVALRRDQLDGQRLRFVASKTGKPGVKRISAQLAKQLRQIAGTVYIFEYRTDPNKHRTRQAVWRDVKSAAAACSIHQNAAPHSARKTYAVEVFHAGGLPAARKELQHDSYGTTLLYALSDKFGSVPPVKKVAVLGSDFFEPPFSVGATGFRIGAPPVPIRVVCDHEEVLRAVGLAPEPGHAMRLTTAEPQFLVELRRPEPQLVIADRREV